MKQQNKKQKVGPRRLASAILDKDKLGLRHKRKALAKQAEIFSPCYRDFVETIVNSSALTIIQDKGGLLLPKKNSEMKAYKRARNILVTDVDHADTLPHELGHAVDYWYGSERALTSTVPLEDGKTFMDILTEELFQVKDRLERDLMGLYKSTVDAALGEGATEIIFGQIDVYRGLRIEREEAPRKLAHERLWETGFVELYYSLIYSDVLNKIGSAYEPLWDLLSSTTHLERLGVPYHPHNYYVYCKANASLECFANLFRAEVCSEYEQMEHFKAYLPHTYAAFQKLFSFAYKGIMSHKRNIVQA